MQLRKIADDNGINSQVIASACYYGTNIMITI